MNPFRFFRDVLRADPFGHKAQTSRLQRATEAMTTLQIENAWLRAELQQARSTIRCQEAARQELQDAYLLATRGDVTVRANVRLN